MPWKNQNGDVVSEAAIRAAHPSARIPRPMQPHHVVDLGYTWEEPPQPSPPTLAEALDSAKRRVTAQRDRMMYGVVSIGGRTLKTDREARELISQSLAFVGRKPNRVVKVKTAEGRHVSMTKSDIDLVFDSLGEFSARCWDVEAAHYAALDTLAADTQQTETLRVAALTAYDADIGWPPIAM